MSFLTNPYWFKVTSSTELWAVTGTGENQGMSSTLTILAQRFETGQTLMGKTITRFDANLKKIGSPTGDLTARIINSANTEKLNMGTLDVSTLTTDYVTYIFENVAGYVLADGDRLAIYYSGASGSNKPDWQMNTTSETNTNGSYYTGSWVERTRDFTMAVWGY